MNNKKAFIKEVFLFGNKKYRLLGAIFWLNLAYLGLCISKLFI